ncbi:CheR family methyltransferase [Roseivirga sp. BDSF3-8]|uniref:CheR family methyltransferase n=1 Tax=Roseivirga sp. BDSF3-8 TaxID=3241598 RepID=UPI003531CA2C
MENNEPFIVGIGASAGGLKALEKLVSGLPVKRDNIAIVIAQHLSPDYESKMVHLLQSHAKWPIVKAENDQPLEGGKIFVCPSDREISVVGNTLCLTNEHEPRQPRPSINRLFHSIAVTAGKRGLGVLLSGTGRDGTEGFKHIKESGGYTIIQNPEEAAYGQMPSSANDAGYVDVVTDAKGIGNEIHKYVTNYKTVTQNGDEEKDQNLKSILRLLANKTGTDFERYKSSTINRRILKRLDALAIPDIEKYLMYIRKNPAELDLLYETVLIGVTEFYRDREAFDDLEKYLKKALDQKPAEANVRIWSVGCATGEEAYSVAIMLHELLGDDLHGKKVQIFATDIDEHALAFGRRGIFDKNQVANFSQELLERYFNLDSGKYEVKKRIRQMVLFSKHDITVDPPFVRLDLITCRNLLIYFKDELQREVMSLFHYALNEKGLLLLGKSESISQLTNLFGVEEKKQKIFRKKSDVQINTLSLNAFKKAGKRKESRSTKANHEMSLEEIAQQTLIHTYEHPYIILDESMEVVYIKGKMQPYVDLSEGALNANALKVIQKDLHIELRAVYNKSKRDKKTKKTKVFRFQAMQGEILVRLTAKPLIYPKNEKDYFMVIFEEIDQEARYPFSLDKVEQDENINAIRVIELEQELEATKEHLQTFTEELETSNEELQSLNEELQSTNEELKSSNEELETSNEELQSANEELQTANTELGLTNETLIEKEAALSEAKQELETIKERFEVALQNSDIFIAYQDKDLRYEWIHNKSTKFANVEVIGQTDQSLIEENAEIIQFKREVMERGKTNRQTFHSNDSYWDTTSNPVFENGNVIGIRTVAINITKQIKSRQMLERQDSITKSIAKENNESILAIDPDYNILIANASFKLLVEATINHSIRSNDNARQFLEHFPDPSTKTTGLFREAFEGKKILIESKALRLINGEEHYYDIRIAPVKDPMGKIIGGAMVCHDVTGRVQMDIQVREVLQRSANLTGDEFFKDLTSQLCHIFKVKYAYVGIMDKKNNDITTKALRVNGKLAQNFTYALPASPCERVSINEHGKYIDGVREKFPEDPKLQRWNAQSYMGVPINSPLTGEILAILVMIDDKPFTSPFHYDHILRILTLRAGAELERQNNENRIRSKDKQLQRITENVPEVIYEYEAHDVDHAKSKFTYLSPSINWIFETTAEEILKDSQKFWNRLHEEDVQSLKDTIRESEKSQTSFSWEGRVVRRETKDIRWIKVVSQPEKERDSTMYRKWHGIIEDITELKNTQLDLIEAREKALSAIRAKEEFLATMSHEIRSPLHAILGLSGILLKEEPRPEQEENLRALKFSSESLMHLINDILDYSQIEAGKAKLEVGPFSLRQLVESLEQAHLPVAKELGNTITTDVGEDVPDIVRGDQMKLAQVLNNLVSNAVKFTNEGRVEVVISLKKKEKERVYLLFRVVDTGIGIPKELQSEVFEKFSRVSTPGKKVKGTGLGLTITKKLLSMMDSTIHLKSEPGKGSEFFFTVPLELEDKTQGALDEPADTPSLEGQNMSILVVEDMEINRMVLIQFMKKFWGVEADEAENGKIALEMIRNKDYDVVLLDVRMPVMDGYECAEAVREMGGKYADLPIIALTADSQDRVTLLDKGNFTDILTKPYAPEDLYNKLTAFHKKK